MDAVLSQSKSLSIDHPLTKVGIGYMDIVVARVYRFKFRFFLKVFIEFCN